MNTAQRFGLAGAAVTLIAALAINLAMEGHPSAQAESSGSESTGGICERTPSIKTAINKQLSRTYECQDVTAEVLAGITDLDIWNTPSIKAGDLDGLTNVTKILLWSSPITSLPAGILDDLTALKNLNLSNNKIASLPDNVFDNNTQLIKLRLDNNKIAALPGGIFDNNTLLESLKLENNEIASLPENVFDNNVKLIDVFLGENKITSLPEGLLDDNTVLEYFYIQNNRLASLPEGLLDNNTALRKMRLDHNELESLPQGIFDENADLRFLRLDNNKLASVPHGLFQNNGLLWHIILSDNKLTELPADLIPDQTESDAAFTMTLHNNQLDTLPDDLFHVEDFMVGQLFLHGNPGAPFAFNMEAEVVSDAIDEEGVGTAQVRYKVARGAPVGMESTLSVTSGTTSTSTVSIGAGEVYSEEFTVTQTASGTPAALSLDSDLTLSVPSRGAWSSGYHRRNFGGVSFGVGPALTLFESTESSSTDNIGGL